MTKEEKYYKAIVAEFIKKIYTRKPWSKQRPRLTPRILYTKYHTNYRDLEIKHALDSAAAKLEADGIITVERLPYSSDILGMYLELDAIERIEDIAKDLGVIVRSSVSSRVYDLAERYEGLSRETDEALLELKDRMMKRPSSIDADTEENIFKGAAFLLENDRPLYIREASCLAYGSSKVMERLEPKLCSLLKTDSLEKYSVEKPDPLIQIRGRVDICMGDGSVLKAELFRSGLGFRAGDLDDTCRIIVRDDAFLTVENQVSFLRHCPTDTATMFLSGFANTAQIRLLKRIKRDNPGLIFLHFGDIDAGGLRILEHLRRETGIRIEPYHMGIEELKNPEYSTCLRPLENGDANNLEFMEGEFPELIRYMLESNCKLEQEIVSLYLEAAQRESKE